MQEKRDTSPGSAFQVEGTQVRQWKLDCGRMRLGHTLSDRSWHYTTVAGLYAEAKTDDARQPDVTWNWLFSCEKKATETLYQQSEISSRQLRWPFITFGPEQQMSWALCPFPPRQPRCKERISDVRDSCRDRLRHITPSIETKDLAKLIAMFRQRELISMLDRDDKDGEGKSSNYISWGQLLVIKTLNVTQ